MGRWAAPILLAVVLGACTFGADSARRPDRDNQLRSGGLVRVGVLGAPSTLDPYAPDAGDLTWTLAAPVWRSLYRFDPDGSVRPDLAASLEIAGGAATIELHIARWPSGAAVTAQDVVLSVRRAPRRSGLGGLVATALGPRTVRLEGAEGRWQQRLARGSFVLPEGIADPETASGAFALRSIVPGLKLRYVRNEQASDPARLDTLEIVFVERFATLSRMLERGRLQAAILPSTVNLVERLDLEGIVVEGRLGWETIRLEFPGLSPARARTVAAAVDRRRLAQVFVRDGRVTHTLHPEPGTGGAAGPWAAAVRPGAAAGDVGIAAATGDELVQLLQRAVVEQLQRAGLRADEIDTPGATIDRPGPAAPVELVRRAGAPGVAGERGGPERPRAMPLFQVSTWLAFDETITGPTVNPTVAGQLWNAGRWGLAR